MGRLNQTLSLLLILLVLQCAAGVSAGEAYHKWVPGEYSEPWTVSKAAFYVLQMTAYNNNEAHLTDRSIRTAFMGRPEADTLHIFVNTRCQPTWDTHVGEGRVSVSDGELRVAYEEAGNAVKEIVERYFPDIDRERVVVDFSITGNPVGIWRNGVMKLEGD